MQVTVGMQKYYLRCYFSKELYSLLAWNKLAPAFAIYLGFPFHSGEWGQHMQDVTQEGEMG